jgi:thiosulfate/3-mercaptopyruvate sulfurtransferase
MGIDSLVSTEWLAGQLGEKDLVVLDCTVWLRPADGGGYRSESGRESFEAGHIPTAGFADLTGELCGPGPLRFAVPAPEQFAAAMGALGVGDGRRVVLYDQNRSMWAARVWWMLRWVGFDDAALLDGGWKAWTNDGLPVQHGPPSEVEPAVLTPRPRPALIADRDEVRGAIGDGATCLIDALGEDQYRGEVNNYGRAGHIPGASNTPAAALVDSRTGRYLPLEVLAERFPADRTKRVITYCGGGIAASSDAFVLTRLGFPDVAVYTASLQEWVRDPANPLTTDDRAAS